jgi:hypothetical protein
MDNHTVTKLSVSLCVFVRRWQLMQWNLSCAADDAAMAAAADVVFGLWCPFLKIIQCVH